MAHYTTAAKHYTLRALWAVLPVRAKVALYKHHRASVARKLLTTGRSW